MLTLEECAVAVEVGEGRHLARQVLEQVVGLAAQLLRYLAEVDYDGLPALQRDVRAWHGEPVDVVRLLG